MEGRTVIVRCFAILLRYKIDQNRYNNTAYSICLLLIKAHFSHQSRDKLSSDLALQAIGSDTKNVLNLSNEKFDILVNDNNAIKKFFPLLDKKLEKHSAELDTVRKSQVRQDKELADLPQLLSQMKEQHEEQIRELREEMSRMQTANEERLEFVKSELHDIKYEQGAMQSEDLPGFRREVSQLVTSKLEFIENTLHERQESVSKEIHFALDRGHTANKKTFTTVAILVGLSIVLQLVMHFLSTPGVKG